MSIAAMRPATSGPTRTSLEVSGDAIIIVEQNGLCQKFEASNSQSTRAVHLLSPIVTYGKIEHNDSKVSFVCKVIPDFEPGMQLNRFEKVVSETFQKKIEQKAEFRIPQLFELIQQEGKHTETLDTQYNDVPYKLIYTYTI